MEDKTDVLPTSLSSKAPLCCPLPVPRSLKAGKAKVKKHPQLKERIAERLELLANDPFNSLLRTHKLKGDLSGAWSRTVDYDCRIVFDFVTDEETGGDFVCGCR